MAETEVAAPENGAAMKALLGVEFKILGSDLIAAYEKMDKGYKMLVLPVNQHNNNGITIDKLLQDIDTLMGKTHEPGKIDGNELTDQLKSALPSTVSLEKLLIKLKTAYLYINSEDGKEAKVEYAFSLDIVTEGVPPEGIEMVDVKRLSVSVWNTEREKILQLMSLQSIDTYLEG